MALTINLTRPYFIRSRSSGKVLDVPAASRANGTAITQYAYHGGVNQRWYFNPVPSVNLAQYASTPVQVTAFTFEVVPYFNRAVVLDVPGGSTRGGTGLIQWSRNGGLNQRWRIVPVTTAGHVKFVSVSNGLVFDIPGGSTSDGAPLQQWGDNGGQNQQWTLSEAPGDSAVITTPANVLHSLLGRWRSSRYVTTVDVTLDDMGYKVTWHSGDDGSLTLEGNTLWVKWSRFQQPARGSHVATLDKVSTNRVDWSDPPAGGRPNETWTRV